MDLLTDSLLFIIISALSFKEAARTSVLSKRWRHLWRAAATTIEFNERFFVRPNDDETKARKRLDFIGFGRDYIDDYTGPPSIISFGLWFSNPTEYAADVSNFIDFAAARGVKSLKLDFGSSDVPAGNRSAAVFDLPEGFYGYEYRKGLETLFLDSCNLATARVGGFVSLKEVSLCRIDHRNGQLIPAVLKNCPVIESLCLKECWDLGVFEVCAPSGSRLVRLAVENCKFGEGVTFIHVDGPKLRFFKFSGTSGEFHLENQQALEEADLDFGMEMEFDDGDGDSLYNLLHCLSSAKVLTICSYILQVLPQGEEPLCMQTPLNVRHLILKTCLHENEFIGITFLLCSCPLLETLTIQIDPAARILDDYEAPFADFSPRDYWCRNILVYSCLRNKLRKVEMKGYRGTMNERMILNYFLAVTRKLDKLHIYVDDDVDHRDDDDEVSPGGGDGVMFRQELRSFLESILIYTTRKVDISVI